MAVTASLKASLCILMNLLRFEMLHPCMNVHESFRDALLHPYESAEALCRRRNKVSTAAKWQVV